jgi:hypothetical protein
MDRQGEAMHKDEPPFAEPPRTLRLTFSYEGDTVRLISRERLEMIPPPSEPVAIREGQSGFWYEVRDTDERILYQRVLQNPIQFDVEVFTSDPNQMLTRQRVANPRGVFVLTAPEIEGAATLVLFSSPLEPARSGQPATELARFDLRPRAWTKEEWAMR